jgi:hypothetical protein
LPCTNRPTTLELRKEKNTVRLGELARTEATADREIFQRECPHPALVFPEANVGWKGPSPYDVLEGDNAPTSRWNIPSGVEKTVKAVRPGRIPAPVLRIETANGSDPLVPWGDMSPRFGEGSVVVFLVKSPRNAFTTMVTVGRASNNDLVLPFDRISKSHAYFMGAAPTWALHDNRSTNGTFVNEARLPEGGSATLACGTVVGFAEVRARFFTPAGLFDVLQPLRAAAPG